MRWLGGARGLLDRDFTILLRQAKFISEPTNCGFVVNPQLSDRRCRFEVRINREFSRDLHEINCIVDTGSFWTTAGSFCLRHATAQCLQVDGRDRIDFLFICQGK